MCDYIYFFFSFNYRINLDKLELTAKVFFPSLHFEGYYDVNARFVNFPLKGKGPLRGNASKILIMLSKINKRFFIESKKQTVVFVYCFS